MAELPTEINKKIAVVADNYIKFIKLPAFL